MPEISTHPTANALALYGNGKLTGAQAATVVAHLETCADCRKAVAALPPDSFLGKVRAAQPGGTQLPPGPSPVRLAASPNIAGRPAASPAPPPNVPPELVNHPKFRIIRELGRGGMGVIYLAEHRVMEKHVALKVISPAVLENPDALARFRAEVKAAGKLDHPNIARAHDADQAGNLHFLVMEFVEGMSLAQLVEKKGPLPVAHACHYIRQAALGLQHASEKGMVHRDIKPQNLMVAPKGVVKVLDFGLARLRSERKGAPGLTQADSFMGTPEYVAPEQATDARTADTRADIYSLGCTLYAVLTGRPPFQEDTLVKLVLAHIEKEPQPLHELRPDVPPELSAVVAKMLAKDPAQRYQKPLEVAQALVPFIKAGVKTDVSNAASGPAGIAAAGTGTRIGGDTSRVKGLGQGEAERPAKAPVAEEEKESPFGDLADVAATAPVPKKAKKERNEARPASAALWKRPVVLAGAGVGVAILLALVILFAPGVFVKTSNGSILAIEVNEPNTDVFVDGEKVTVTWDKGGKKAEIGVKPGTHKLEVKKDGFMMYGEEVEIKDGKRQIFTAKLSQVASLPPPVPGADTATFFNGKNLAGWDYLPGRWSVKDSAIIGSTGSDGITFNTFLSSTKKYKDFELTFQVKLTGKGWDGNSGVQIRSEVFDKEHWAVEGPQCDMGDKYWGSLYGEHFGGMMKAAPEAMVKRLLKANDFNDYAIKCVGKHVTIRLNGETTVDEDFDSLPAEGIIAWQLHSGPPMEVTFRQIQFTDLSKRADEGFVPLFNGKDLAGWKTYPKQPGNWRVLKGTGGDVLTGSGSAASYLYTERDDYKDFHLLVEARINDGGNSGVYFRAPFGPKIPVNNPAFPLGYEAQINSTHRDVNKTGSLYAGSDGAVVSLRESPVPAGKWFKLEVIAQGNHHVIKINGKTTADYTDLTVRFANGHIALQQLDPQTEAEFRKIEIKELPSK